MWRLGKIVDEKTKSLALARWARSDQEFLPAAVSILETPASPVRIGLLWAICLLMGAAILFGSFGHIDILAVAQGKVQPTGRVKTIQPLETGRVVALHVENGQHVKAGEALVELDPAEAVADEQASQSALAAYKAERLRRRAALAAAESAPTGEAPKIEWPEDVPPPIREREQRVLDGDLRQLRVSVRSYDAQIAQKKDEERRLENTIQSEQALIDTLQQRVEMRKGLLARGSTPKAAVLDALEALQTQETQLAMQKGQLLEARAAQEVLAQERQKTIETFVADNSQKLSEAERQVDDLEQKFAKAHAKTGHMTLVSPISGTVLGLSVTSKHQVLTTSEELMRIVPDDAELERLGQARIHADVQRVSVRAAVVQAYSQFNTAKAAIKFNGVAVKAAETALRGVRDEAAFGQRTTYDVLKAQQDLLDARVNLVTSQRDLVVGSYAILAAVGGLSLQTLDQEAPIYDPRIHFNQIKDSWIGFSTPDGR